MMNFSCKKPFGLLLLISLMATFVDAKAESAGHHKRASHEDRQNKHKRHKRDCKECCEIVNITEKDFCLNGTLSRTVVLNKPGYYRLCGDINFVPQNQFTPAIQILSSNVTLDLGGFRLNQANTVADTHAIVLGDSTGLTILNNITIKNGSITKFTGVGIKALNLTPSEAVIPFKNLQFLDLNILEVGTSVAPTLNPYAASGIDLHSLLASDFEGAPYTKFAYDNVIIKRCNVNNCLGNGAISIQTGIDIVIEDTNANDLVCNFGGNTVGSIRFVSAYFLFANNISMSKCQGCRTQRFDTSTAVPGTASCLNIAFANNVFVEKSQFNDCFDLTGVIACGMNASGANNTLFIESQFNNARGSLLANAVHASDLPFGRATFGGKFVNCQFNGASIIGLAAGNNVTGPLIAGTIRDVTFERCEVRDIKTNSATQTFGFRVLGQPQDPIPFYADAQNITFRDCIVSNLQNGNSLSGGANAIGYQIGSFGPSGNRIGMQTQSINYVLDNCIAEKIHSFSINNDLVAGIGEIATSAAPTSPLSGPVAQNINLLIKGCRISDVKSRATVPSTLSAGIVTQSVKHPVIRDNTISDCNRGILLTGSIAITPATLFQLATSPANAAAFPPIALDLTGTTQNSTGTASQTGNIVQGFGTTFTANMVGGTIAFSPVTGIGSQTGNIVTATAPIFTEDMIGSTISFPDSAYLTYIVEFYSATQVAVSTTLPVALPPAQTFTVNVHAAPIAAVDVANQQLTVVPGQRIPQQPFVITYGLPAGPQSFRNQRTGEAISITPVSVQTPAVITNVTGNGTTVTYTANNNFIVGTPVTIAGVTSNPAGVFNLVNQIITSATPTQFTVANSATGTYIRGGTATIQATVELDRDFLFSPINLNALGWRTGDPILYDNLGNGNIPELETGNTYFLIVYTPGFTNDGVILSNEVDNCTLRGYQENRPGAVGLNGPNGSSTTSAWINNVAVDNSPSAVITNASGNGVTVTFTATNSFVVGDVVTIASVNPAAYNLTSQVITSATPTQFTIANSATGAYVSGGVATLDNGNYDIRWNPGPNPVDVGFVGGPTPAPGNKYYNLSLKPN